MIALLLQIVSVAAVVGYFLYWCAAMRRRKAQTWDGLVARLRMDWTPRAVQESVRNADEATTPEDLWQSLDGPRGLCVMYQNARVMMEMANFAVRHNAAVDRELVVQLHKDALRIRVLVGTALAQYAFTQVNARISASALRAAASYTGMMAHMTDLMQAANGGAQTAMAGAM